MYTKLSVPNCCGLCSQAGINGDGTIIATVLGTLLNLLLTYFKPDEALGWIAGQLLVTDCYLLPALIRVAWGAHSGGRHGLQRFHIEYILVRASSALAIIGSAVFMEPCHLNGFKDNEDWEKSLDDELHQSEAHHSRLKKAMNLHSRHAGWFTLGFYLAHVAGWIAFLPLLTWLGKGGFWQENCQSLVDENLHPIVMGASIAFIATGGILLIIMGIALHWRRVLPI